MTTCARVRPLLSDYVDRRLDVVTDGTVRDHLTACDDCRGIADDLDRLRGVARSLGPIPPPAHLWIEVAGRVRLEGAPSGVMARSPDTPTQTSRRGDSWQWLGLAAALVLVTLGVYSMAQPDVPAPDVSIVDSNASEVPTVETVEETMRRAEAEYEKAIAQLEQIVTSGDTDVSAETVATLQRNLTIIDSAIAESRVALTDSPDSQPARTSLFEAMRNKVNLLQQTVVLLNEMRKGDAGGAADAAAGFGKTS